MYTRILIATAWVVSILATYYVASSGIAKTPSLTADKSGAASSDTVMATGESGSDGRSTKIRAFIDSSGVETDGAQSDIPTIIARVRAAMAGSMGPMGNFRTMIKAMAPLADLTPAQIQQALEEVERTVKEPQQKMMFHSLLLGQWAEVDGKAALDYADKHIKNSPMFEMGGKASIVAAWALQKPDEALRWFEKERANLGDNRNGQMLIGAVFGGLASGGHLDVALARLETLSPEERAMALSGISNTTATAHARQRILDRAASMPDDIRKSLQQGVVGNWVMSEPDKAIEWIRKMPLEEQKNMREIAGQRLSWMDPKKSAEIMMENAEAKDLPRLYDRVVGPWAQADVRAAGEWLSKQSQGPELDDARMTYVAVSSNRDPSAAMEWASTITNSEKRVSSVSRLYKEWRAKDSKAAEQGLAASGLPASEIAKVQEGSPGQAGE